MTTQHFRAIWPVLDETLPLTELTTEAQPDLANILRRARLWQAGRTRWCIRMGQDVPGSGGAHLVLVADLPVVAVARDVDPITGERDETRVTRYEVAS